ncbi:tobamovirus multiplication protein 1-like protein [Tanacetum coccineum]
MELVCNLEISFLLYYRVDLCHHANDEDEDEGFPREPLLKKVNKANSKVRSRRRCCNIQIFPIGSRQQVVILVTLLIFVIMLASTVLIWIGPGKNPIDSSVVRVYVDTFAVAMLLLGGALCPEPLCNSCQVNVLSNFL